MKLLRKNIFSIIILGILISVYYNWFTKGLLSAPDFPYYYSQRLVDFYWQQFAWSNVLGNGLGGTTLSILNLDTYVHVGVRLFVFALHIPWSIASRMLLFWPFLVIGILSSFLLTNTILKNKNFAALGMLIYMSNTYILMLASGGQMGLVLAYAFAPLVIASFIKKNFYLFTSSLFLLILFDLRFSYLTAIFILLYIFFVIPKHKWLDEIKFAIVPGLITVGLHNFWLVPSIFSNSFRLPEGYGSPNWLSYLSWADFSRTLSFLHPNWPENIFGKVGFMKPEFLIFPILAYSSLFFISKIKDQRTKSYVLFFALLGLIGAFLAKGVNPPFGQIYAWLFSNVPFFNGFRDPTKFYLLTILSYTVLIPLSLKLLAEWLQSRALKIKDYKASIGIILAFLFIWLILLSPVFIGTVKGTFSKLSVPNEYTNLEKLIGSETDFSRTLAVPWRNRFIFESENQPVINASDIFNTTDISKIIKMLQDPKTANLLKDLAVKYVVIPNDFTNEIFLSDRKYDIGLRQSVENNLDKSPNLIKQNLFGGLTVYESNNYSGLFFTVLPNGIIAPYSSHKINPVTYAVDINVLYRPAKVIFSQKYDPNWVLWDGEKIITSQKTSDGMNSFLLNSLITNQITVYYRNQRLLEIGVYISLSVLLILIIIFYIKVTKWFKLGKKFHLIVFLIILSVLFVLKPKDNSINILNNKNIWWSKEWRELKNPFVEGKMILSRYGGDEIRFNIGNTQNIDIKVTSSNNYDKAQGIGVSVDGKTYELETPNINEKELKIVLDNIDKTKKHSIRIRHWCGGSYSACDLALREIKVDNKAFIAPPSSVPTKILAMFGDSISVSFGDSNYTYLLADKLGYQLHNAGFFGMTASFIPGWETGKKQYYWESGVEKYQKDIVSYKPDVILVYLGTNDLTIPVEIFRNNYEKMVRGIKEGSPKSKIILVGLLRRKDYNIDQILIYSNMIQEIAKENDIDYINSYNFLDETDLQDNIHPAKGSQQNFFEKFYENLSLILRKK